MFATVQKSSRGTQVRLHSADTATALWDTAAGRVAAGLAIADVKRDGWGVTPGAGRRGMARPGSSLYGFDPSDEVRFGQIRPVMTLMTVVSMVKEMQPGQSASYGRRFTADKPTLVATLCTGYADGYPRQLSCGKGIVEIHGKACPVLGRVCMDQFIVGLHGSGAELGVHEGDTVELIGPGRGEQYGAPPAADWARAAATLSYEVFTCLRNRIPRLYLHAADVLPAADLAKLDPASLL